MSTVGGFVPLPRVIIGRGPVYLRCLCKGSLSRTATAAVPSRFITRRAYVQSSHDELADRARGETEGGDRSASESDTTQRPGMYMTMNVLYICTGIYIYNTRLWYTNFVIILVH